MTIMRAEDVPECSRPEGHCWHRATLQHAVPDHVDETCCHCGVDRCLSTLDKQEAYRAQHGPHCP